MSGEKSHFFGANPYSKGGVGRGNGCGVPTPVDKKQLQLIHIAKTQLALDDETYRETLQYRYNVSSAKDLTYNQASNFIGFLSEKGFKFKKKSCTLKAKKADNLIELATPAQHRLIDVLKNNIVWKYENGYELYIQKRLKINKVITKSDAFKVINALKGLLGINTKIIELQALPFPWNPETKWFNNSNWAWFFDISKSRLVKLNVYGEEVV